jgi:hypothetical protein
MDWIFENFQNYRVSVAFKTQNTMSLEEISCLLRPVSRILHSKMEDCDRFDKSGVYKIHCDGCDNFYFWQTVNFVKQYKNHASTSKNNKLERLNVTWHLLENGLTLNNIEGNLNVLQIFNKDNIMNAWEELYIFNKERKDRDKLINKQVNFYSYFP